MRVSCPACHTNYNIDDNRIPASGAKLKCAKCQAMFPIKPAARAAPAEAVPLPGGTAPAAAVPLPGAFDGASSAVPLPGNAPPPPPGQGAWGMPPVPTADDTGAVPLPGSSAAPPPTPDFGGPASPPADFSAPFDGDPLADGPAGAGSPWDNQQTRTYPPGSLPLEALRDAEPGADDSAVPLPGAPGFAPAPGGHGDAVPLPSSRPSAAAVPPSAAFNEPLGFDAAPDDAGAVPLPGERAAAPPDFGGLSPSPQPFAAAPPPADSFDIDALPPAPPAGADLPPAPDPLDFDLAPPPPPPAAPKKLDFDDLPSPAAAVPDPLAFDDLPSPAGAPPAPPPLPSTQASASPPPELDFSNLPAPAQPAESFDLDFSALPPPPAAPAAAAPANAAPPSLDDFNFDLGAPPPPPPSTAVVNPSADFGEVDFSEPPPAGSPAPAAAPPLETLEFEGTTQAPPASPAAEGTRFHVRRKSGKVFGPFDEAVLVKMLEEGQLLGNEDISNDGDQWSPIGSVEVFAQALQKLSEAPPQAAPPPAATEEKPQSAQAAASMERLKQLYEGRMAAVTVVDRGAVRSRLRIGVPLLVAGLAVLLVIGAGAALGTTRYGFFGLKLLFPAKIKAGTREFADLERARKALLAGTFKGFQEARDAAAAALRVKEYPEARAVWCQAVFYLQRKYSGASAAELANAKGALDPIQLLGEKHVEVIKALAGDALVRRDADAAIRLLDDAVARAGADDELSFLRAEAYALKGQTKLAQEALKKLLERSGASARAHHALGDLHQAAKEAELAARSYEKALEADPNHVASAVELAAVELLLRKDAEKGLVAVDRALAEERKALLGPAELARATALKAQAMALQFKPKEAIELFEEALKLDPGSTSAKGGLAGVFLSQKQFDRALPLFKEAAAQEPQNLELTEGYLASLVGAGKMEDALKEVAAANGRFPGNARIAYLSGRVNAALDHLKEAETDFIRAANADPTLFEANLHLARLYLRTERPAEAKPQLETALAKAPDSAAVHAGLGELALSGGDLDKAQSEFDQAVAADPNLADAHVGLSKTALARGDAASALKFADRALELDPHVKGGRLQRGLVLWKLGKLDEAIAELTKAKDEDPRDIRIPVKLGTVQLVKGELAGAEGTLMAALRQEPNNHDALFQYARVKNRRSEHTQAIDSMRSALSYAPKRADYLYHLGLFYRDARQINDAVEAWTKASELDPLYPEPLEALGQAFFDRGEVDKAIGYFEKALAAAPSRSRLIALIGDCHFQAARWSEAIALYQKALAADPGLKDVYFKLGRCFTEKGNHAQAINWYRKVTEVDAGNAMAYYHLGYAYKESRRRRDAIQAFKSYLEKKPDALDKRDIEDEIYDLEQGN